MFRPHFYRFFLFLFSLLFAVSGALAQGTSGNVNGTITDPSGAVVAGATVQIANPVSGYTRTTKSDASGQFQFFNVPFNPYRLTVTEAGFQPSTRSLEINSTVPSALAIKLSIAGNSSTVEVENVFGPHRDRSELPYGCRSFHHRPASARERVVVAQLDCDAVFSGCRSRLEWFVSRARGSR